jgi:CheY-like chemotaxis protein
MTLEVVDSEELLDYLRRLGRDADPSPASRPGLILLDLNMPRKDGHEALAEIKADPELRQIAAVAMIITRASKTSCGRTRSFPSRSPSRSWSRC